MSYFARGLILFIAVFGFGAAVRGQNFVADVYVTTQYDSSFRAGPGERFDRLAVVQAAVTLPAVGRSADMGWIQVEYEGQRGWIAARLLVWSGDIVSLPVDGVDPDPFIRRALVLGVTTRETPIYRRVLVGSDRVGSIPVDTEVEIIGRLGLADRYWMQIRYEGEQYWVGSWDIRLLQGDIQKVMDTSYLYAYGRLLEKLETDVNRSIVDLNQMESTWQSIAYGNPQSCITRTPYVLQSALDGEFASAEIYQPIVEALDSGVFNLNSAVSAFNDACSQSDRLLTLDEVNAVLAQLTQARRQLTLAQALVNAMNIHNPLLIRTDLMTE